MPPNRFQTIVSKPSAQLGGVWLEFPSVAYLSCTVDAQDLARAQLHKMLQAPVSLRAFRELWVLSVSLCAVRNLQVDETMLRCPVYRTEILIMYVPQVRAWLLSLPVPKPREFALGSVHRMRPHSTFAKQPHLHLVGSSICSCLPSFVWCDFILLLLCDFEVGCLFSLPSAALSR